MAEFFRKVRVDPVIRMRLVLRFNCLLHGNVPEVGVGADRSDVVALQRRAGRKNNIGHPRRSRPHRVAHDRRFGLFPSLHDAVCVFLLSKGVAARPEDQTNVWIGDFLAVVVDRLAGI